MNKDTIRRIRDVKMGDSRVASYKDERCILGTDSLADCAGIMIHDPRRKVGGVSHVHFDLKNNRSPKAFDRFEKEAHGLVEMADKYKGGLWPFRPRYNFTAFNIQEGKRTQEQNAYLENVVERTIRSLKNLGKIRDVGYSPERRFLLDTSTGKVSHEDWQTEDVLNTLR